MLSEQLSTWQKTYIAASAVYPLWYLFGPTGAQDPWIIWWGVSAAFLLVVAIVRWRGVSVPGLEFGFAFVVNAHIFTLAAVNSMHPFYAMGSMVSGTLIGSLIPNRRALNAYVVIMVLQCSVLAALFPHPMLFALWIQFVPLSVCFYYRLKIQEEAGVIAARQRVSLERAVRIRTRALENRSEELTETNARLRAEIDERKRLEERLVVSQRLEALGRLAGGVAHDFNNFVTTICGYSEFALESLSSDHPARADVERIGHSAERATELVNQLLAFSRQNTVQSEVLDLDAVCAEMESILNAVLPEHIHFERRSAGPAWFSANRSQIEQVILNLVVNARDAMQGGGSLVLEVAEFESTDERLTPFVEGQGRFALLRVSDTGVGMNNEVRSRVFDPFFTTKPVNEGTGLGLSIVHEIVKQSEGHLRIRSEPNQGTTLEIAWPVVLRDEAAEQREEKPSKVGSERVLVVEDEPEVRRLVVRSLQQHGYTVFEAEDAEGALLISKQEDTEIDLLVADVVMPRVSGFELATQIRATRPRMRVIFISGHTDHPSLRSDALPKGTAFVAKPFAPQNLARKVREVLDLPAL